MQNALTIDVEDYFQVTAFSDRIDPGQWDRYPSRVEGNTRRILDWLDRRGVKATFFVLGWVAKRQPSLVRDIHRAGHEIASHGYGHQLLSRIGPLRFRADIHRSKGLLEDLTGAEVRGYRAPTYSITEATSWAFDILVEEGYGYDSSIYPIVHDLYGMPRAERFPHRIRTSSGSLNEFPITTLPLKLGSLKWRLPVGGGGYLRLLPASLIEHAFLRINQTEGEPCVLYFHPWEIDPDQPRMQGGWRSRFRHYHNLGKTFDKLTYLAERFSFATMQDVLDRYFRERGPLLDLRDALGQSGVQDQARVKGMGKC